MTTYRIRAEIADGRSWIDEWNHDNEDVLADVVDYAYTDGDWGYPPNVAQKLGIPKPENDEDETLYVQRIILIRPDETERVVFDAQEDG